MNKINYPETTAQTNAWEVFNSAIFGQMFLLINNINNQVFLAQKCRGSACSAILVEVSNGNKCLDPDVMESALSSATYTLTPVDVEINVIIK